MDERRYPRAVGPAVWRGDEIAAQIVYPLDATQARAVAEVARRYDSSPATLGATDFTRLLPCLAPLMARARTELLAGRGVALMRGVPVAELTEDQCAVAFWAIGSFLGQGVSQSSAGDLIGFVQDLDHKVRSYLNRSSLRYHVDLADLVGLMCVRRAMSGGESIVVSSLAIYNEMLDHHPEYLDALDAGFHWSRNNEEGPGEAPYSRIIPVFTAVDGEISCRFSSSMIRRGTEAQGGTLTDLQDRALTYMEETAARLAYRMYMEPGDIQFMNNYTTLHSRSEFENWPERSRHRLLLRLWLRDENIRKLGTARDVMRDEPLIYGKQGRTPQELQRMGG